MSAPHGMLLVRPDIVRLYEILLVRLHVEMSEGRGEEELADTIRDDGAELWYQLSDSEQELVDELSEDLYMIEGERLPAPLPAQETAASVREDMQSARTPEQYRQVLRSLRRLEHADAYMHGVCWHRLGFRLAAKHFAARHLSEMLGARVKICADDVLITDDGPLGECETIYVSRDSYTYASEPHAPDTLFQRVLTRMADIRRTWLEVMA